MDETFWANVVKRWSEASENVLKLKEELTRLQSEVESLISTMEVVRSNHETSSAFYIAITQRARHRDTVFPSFQRTTLLEMHMRMQCQRTVAKIVPTSY